MMTQRHSISIHQVQETVAAAFHLNRAELLSRSRRQRVIRARHVAMYLSRELAGFGSDHPCADANEAWLRFRGVSFPRIGLAFDRDHSSVIHACDAIARRRQSDAEFASMLEALARSVCERAGVYRRPLFA
ncbi:MAG: helix-turn-helix domain-containing protein [Candidatus Binataceae bacterium]